jgi:pyruvate-formate lyase-activating enzyme
LVYADEQGRLYDWPGLEMAGSCGGRWRSLVPGDWIPLPPGSELFVLPQRLPVGYHRSRKRFEVLRGDPCAPGKAVQAVAAFIAPAHTQELTAAYRTLAGAPLLPLFAYTAVGWYHGEFVVSGFRVDPSDRQDIARFDLPRVAANARRQMAASPANRLLQHLGTCALSYACPAARNYFLERWEAPLPSSPTCNARCLGCISRQTRRDLRATQDRIDFVPTAAEIAAIAVPHLENAPEAIVSFGQGCEGEPLLQADTLRAAVRLMRRATGRGTVHLNTNGSLPAAARELIRTGLNSVRVTLNSCREAYYNAYHRPRGFTLEDVKRCLQAVKAEGGFASLNYLVTPGVTDETAEYTALRCFVAATGVDLIQMRNLNIDPEWYLRAIDHRPAGKPMGIRGLMARLKQDFPELRFGYFNPSLDPQAAIARHDGSHPGL